MLPIRGKKPKAKRYDKKLYFKSAKYDSAFLSAYP